MKSLVIRPIPLLLGASRLSDHTYRVDLNRKVITGTYIWFIEGTEQKILVDAGSDAESFRKAGYPGRVDVQTVEEGLAKLGLKPEDIEIVILTQLHFDHRLFMPKYPNARFIVQKAELECMKKPFPFERRTPMTDDDFKDFDIQLIDGDFEVTEGVNILFTPGHTGGGQSVAVDTAKGRAIISGLCTIPENFHPPEELNNTVPVIPPYIHVDLQQSFDSLLRIKREADIIVPLHEVTYVYVDAIPKE